MLTPLLTLLATRSRRLLALLIMLPWLAVLIGAFAFTASSLRPELDAKTRAVGQGLTGPIENALALGIPLARLAGMAEFMGGALGEVGDIDYAAVTDTRFDLLHLYKSPGYDGLVDLAAGPGTVRLALKQGQDVAGYLVLGRNPQAMLDLYWRGLWEMLMALVVALLIPLELARFLLERQMLEPGRLADGLARRVAALDFTHAARFRGSDEIARLLTALSRMIRHVNRRQTEFLAHAHDVQEAVFDPTVAERVDQQIQHTSAELRFADPVTEVPPRQDGSLRRLMLFLITLALTLPIPAFTTLQGGAGMAALTAALLLLTLGLSGRLLDRLNRLIGCRAMALLGGGLAMAGLWVAAGQAQATPMLIIAALVGTGLGCLLHATGDAFGLASANLSVSFERDRVQTMATGLLCGAAGAHLIGSVAVDPATALQLAGLLLGLTGLTGALMHPLAERSPRPETWLNPIEIGVVATRLPLMIYASQALLPLRALITVYVVLLPWQFSDNGGDSWAAEYGLLVSGLGLMAGLMLGDRLGMRTRLAQGSLTIGLALAGLAVSINPWTGDMATLLGFAVGGLAVGVAQPAQAYLRADLARHEQARIGEKRVFLFCALVDCLAGVLALLLAMVLLPMLGPAGTVRTFGVIAVAASLVFFLSRTLLPAEIRGGRG